MRPRFNQKGRRKTQTAESQFKLFEALIALIAPKCTP